MQPICEKHDSTLVSVNGIASRKHVEELFLRLKKPTIILCLSDLSPGSAFFAHDLAETIEELLPPGSDLNIRVKSIGLLPKHILELKIPMVRRSSDPKENKDKFKKYLKSHSLDPKTMAELDALEVYYPKGIAGFLDDCLSKYRSDFDPDDESWLLDLRKGISRAHNR